MGREADAGGWLEYFHANTQAWLDDQVTLGLLPASVRQRGWKAAMARALGIYDVQISRWVDTDPTKLRIPDVDSCRALARLWGVSPVEVLVAAGHLDPEDVTPGERPRSPSAQESPRLKRLAKALEGDLPPEVRARIEQLLDVAAGLAQDSATGKQAGEGTQSA